MIESSDFNKCFLGIKAESLAVALALPKYNLHQLALVDRSDHEEVKTRLPFSRKCITFADKTYWNYYLKLFSPKEIDSINNFLDPLTIYLRSGKQVLSLGQNSWFDNLDIFFKKQLFLIQDATWAKFNELNRESVNGEFEAYYLKQVEESFYRDVSFEEFFKNWKIKKTVLTEFMNFFLEDWMNFFRTNAGIKFWRLVPSLYRISVDTHPNEASTAEFVFNLIQPHYYFNEVKFNELVLQYCKINNSFIGSAVSSSVVEEDKKILHIMGEAKQPIRSDKFWEFPDANFLPSENGLIQWTWLSNGVQQTESNPKKIIIDLNDFMIDQHYFCATIALIDQRYEMMFLQKNQTFLDKQLEKKLALYFDTILKIDSFWSTWQEFHEGLSSKNVSGPLIECAFHYNESSKNDRPNKLLQWNKVFQTTKELDNLHFLGLISGNQSYWTHYLHQVTRILWKDLYDATF